MEQIKTLEDINNFIHKLQFTFMELPPNLELKITLGMNDFIAIQKEMISIVGNLPVYPEGTYKHAVGNTWITYQYMGVKTNIELVNYGNK